MAFFLKSILLPIKKKTVHCQLNTTIYGQNLKNIENNIIEKLISF